MSQAFWEWSLETYDRADVSAAGLALQDQFGLNVNILLWCCWLAREGRDAGPLVEQASRLLEPWSRDITGTIRETRQKLKQVRPASGLYKSLLACELDAEHIEQDILFELAANARQSAEHEFALARNALLQYAHAEAVEVDFTSFLRAIFSDPKNV